MRKAILLYLLLGSTAVAAATQPAALEYFSEVAVSTGLGFVHWNGMSGAFYLPEIMGSGSALFDYDNDGDLDVYIVQGSDLGPAKLRAAVKRQPSSARARKDRLFRNDLELREGGVPVLRFTDVSASAGIRSVAYGMGVTAGDFDNDGWVDLYVTNLGKNQLLRNNGDGGFSEVADRAGVADASWSVSAAFLDYDRDGWLDLYVGNYVRVDLENDKPCRSPSSTLDYCTPLVYPALPDRLYRNLGDGTFEDVSRKAGLHGETGAGLGVVVADFNADGWSDIYVANDATANQLWLNQRDGTFRDEAMLAGAAVNLEGAAEGSMGVDAADFDGDGDEDLFMTHLAGETNTIYINDGKGWFEDRTISVKLAGPSKPYTGFGTGWFDFDNDGWLDVFTANGAVTIVKALSDAADPYPLHQPNQLFANQAGQRFREVSGVAGKALSVSEVSRGAAFGDLDNDGDTDIVVVNNNGPARLLRNNVGNRANWLGLRLLNQAGRDALGARVEIPRSDRASLWRRVRVDGSYASANDPRVLLGLAKDADAPLVRVYWPDGQVEEWPQVLANRYTTLRQGHGKPHP